MSLWLPHGLAPSVQLADLARQVTLCKYQDAYKVGPGLRPAPPPFVSPARRRRRGHLPIA